MDAKLATQASETIERKVEGNLSPELSLAAPAEQKLPPERNASAQKFLDEFDASGERYCVPL